MRLVTSSQGEETADIESTLPREVGERFWVLVAKDNSFEPLYVEAGATDLDYSEVLGGIESGAEVLLLPSSGMLRTQKMVAERIERNSRLAGIMRRRD